jgi:hypothetical protein
VEQTPFSPALADFTSTKEKEKTVTIIKNNQKRFLKFLDFISYKCKLKGKTTQDYLSTKT